MTVSTVANEDVDSKVTYAKDLETVVLEYAEPSDPARRSLFTMTSTSKPYGDDGLDLLYSALSEMLDKGTHFVALYDIRDYATPSPAMAYSLANRLKDLAPRFEKQLKASVVVLDGGFFSSVVAGLIGTVNTIMPPPCPTTIVYSVDEAHDFLRGHWYEQKEEVA